ncbi:hypothetical protein ACFYMW_03210 [Streptomyces sp. NPDC006692]|uniref:hypothetical protein n=1 Tax=Streptomyces sp. NPDC006692 TaxID=3364758 RepID=UPI0036AEF127
MSVSPAAGLDHLIRVVRRGRKQVGQGPACLDGRLAKSGPGPARPTTRTDRPTRRYKFNPTINGAG